MVTETELDDAATALRGRLERIFDKPWLPEISKEKRARVRELMDRQAIAEHWESLRSAPVERALVIGEWAESGACRRFPGLDWFDWGSGLNEFFVKNLKRREIAICQSCHVKAECLAHALEVDEPAGIWGGLLPSERRELR